MSWPTSVADTVVNLGVMFPSFDPEIVPVHWLSTGLVSRAKGTVVAVVMVLLILTSYIVTFIWMIVYKR